jgi:hypothetical protein
VAETTRPTGYLIDSNVLLDVATEDPHWYQWSSTVLTTTARTAPLLINPLIYAEVSANYDTIEELDRVVSLPCPNASSGERRCRIPPDLWQRAHSSPTDRAAANGDHRCRTSPSARMPRCIGSRWLPRDTRRYRGYFPSVEIVSPDPA